MDVTAGRVVVNGRFRRQPVTGVQRYATEVVRRLPSLVHDVVVAEPPGRRGTQAGGRLGAATDHLWEQVALPVVVGRASSTLVSLCNWGPVVVGQQVLTVHDLAPLVVPEAFPAGYVQRFRSLGLATAARVQRLVAVSARTADALADRLGVDRSTVTVVEPGVVAPPRATTQASGAQPPFALLVGAHDPRKGARAVLRWWPEVYRRTGLRLVLTARTATVFGDGGDPPLPSWCTVRTDPGDEALWRLYTRATLLLSPSRYEGFGLPLLEALSCGTPFLSSDVGAAADLAVEDWWVVPDDRAAWIARIERLAGEAGPALASVCRQQAAPYTWERAAAGYAALLGELGAALVDAGDGAAATTVPTASR